VRFETERSFWQEVFPDQRFFPESVLPDSLTVERLSSVLPDSSRPEVVVVAEPELVVVAESVLPDSFRPEVVMVAEPELVVVAEPPSLPLPLPPSLQPPLFVVAPRTGRLLQRIPDYLL
jgi:hypothetical protein